MSDITEFKCPNCGAPLKYNIETQKMVCSFCANAYDLDYIRNNLDEAAQNKQDSFDRAQKDAIEADKPQKLVNYTCPSCGGNILTFSNRTKVKCPFCEHDLIVTTNFKGDVRPDKIIPFSKTLKDFENTYWGYIANSKYIPIEFKKRAFEKKAVGRYIPIWLYSCSCSVTGADNSTTEFKFKKYPVLGTDFDSDVFYEIESFDYNEAVVFTESCLTGFYASRYTIGAESAMKSAERKIKEFASVHYSDNAEDGAPESEGKQDITISDQMLTYYLVPVWIMKVKYKSEEYTFAMNGQTGEMSCSELFLEYRRMGEEKEKKYSAINKKAYRYLKVIGGIFLLLLILIIILRNAMDDDSSFISNFINHYSSELWEKLLIFTAVVFGIIYAVNLSKANPFIYNCLIKFDRHIRPMEYFIYDEKKTMPESNKTDNTTTE